MLGRVCRLCSEYKCAEHFLVRDKAKGTLRTECKSCQAAIRAGNKERITAYNKAYHASNREAMSKRNKAYHEQNRSELLPVMRVRNIARYHADSEYQYRVLVECAAKRAPSKKFIPSWSDVASIEAIYSYAAALRKAGLSAEVDHIVPIKSKLVCGLHVHENLQILTKSENCRKKNTRWPTDMPYAETPFRLPL